ncbi:GNAT family N-acetyltransferase [Pyxidicoccus parkwayensis]|uniref:GNAT family N-acetyltransferase n=1 Tax=Pyxidicoccus parkwayensis TaxID=2813578 RepID=A0ABX7NZU5_9BACT|nr:GNAT family N-acetyltransferase [Pyxidicoccus parkwaysis]QSQ24452.1 GNAT family N-acetyltransferase [Pyxidicoccus parkwaysis]
MSRCLEPLEVRVVASIRDVPGTHWDDTVARGHPFKSSAFLSCLEDAFPERCFAYVLMLRGGRLVGLALVTEERFDLGLRLSAAAERVASRVRRLLPGFLTVRLAMVGTMETAQRHWWVDTRLLSEEEFADALLVACEEACPRADLLVVRDFMEGDDADARMEARFLSRGFRPARNLPLAVVELEGRDFDAHLRRLRRKPRASVSKQLAAARRLGLKLERVHDFRPLLPECYPLYLQVHHHATELKRPPIPRSFFEHVSERLPGESSLLTLRTSDGQLVGFVLSGTSGRVHNPFVLGMDYARSRELPIYYSLLGGELAYAAERGCMQVDLGVTCYFIKQTLGATLEGMRMVARLRSRWLRPFLSPLLPVLLSEKQPERRRTFRHTETGAPQRTGASGSFTGTPASRSTRRALVVSTTP